MAASRDDDRSPQQRFEESTAGRLVISALLALTVGTVVVWNLPPSTLRATLEPVVTPYSTLAGLMQSWRIFAPDPRQTSIEVYACVEYDDGSQSIWEPPGGRVIGPYRSYRWLKWIEQLRLDARAELWEPAATYLARAHADDGRTPVSVTLTRRWADVARPGSGDVPEWREYDFYRLSVDESSSSGSGDCNAG